MAVKIRLSRIGKRDDPKYRLIAIDSHKRRNAVALETLGFYDPGTNPPKIDLNQARINVWLKKGAALSDSAKSLLKVTK